MKLGVNARAFKHTHLQTPVTLCREQSIRGYVSKESMLIWVGKIVVLVCKEGLLCTLTLTTGLITIFILVISVIG